jgi:hypothetical protein
MKATPVHSRAYCVLESRLTTGSTRLGARRHRRTSSVGEVGDRGHMSGVVFVGEAHGGAADLQAEWDRASLRLLPRLLAAERGEVEVAVAVVELFDATAERGVGVENLVADAEECAEAGRVRAQASIGTDGPAGGAVLLPGRPLGQSAG